jgi:hypothetical protein
MRFRSFGAFAADDELERPIGEDVELWVFRCPETFILCCADRILAGFRRGYNPVALDSSVELVIDTSIEGSSRSGESGWARSLTGRVSWQECIDRTPEEMLPHRDRSDITMYFLHRIARMDMLDCVLTWTSFHASGIHSTSVVNSQSNE